MRKLIWLLSGVVIGFVTAHFVNQTPEGRRFFDRVNRGVEEFGRAFAAGYHDEESGEPSAPSVPTETTTAPVTTDEPR